MGSNTVFKDIQFVMENETFVDKRNLIGKTFGKLTVRSYITRVNGKTPTHCWCECECGAKYKSIARGSLTRGATTSCGCNYKSNGAKVAKDIHWYQDKVKNKYKLIGNYLGYNSSVTVACISCGDELEGLAKAIAFLPCPSCKSGINVFTEAVSNKGFYVVDYDTKLCSCQHCKIERVINNIEECSCPCRRDVEDPVAVYILTSPTKDYLKIGKAVNPVKRVKDINKSGGEDFVVAKTYWVSGDKCAYLLESHLHNKFGGRNQIARQGFSGDTEIFNTTLDSVKAYVRHISKKMKHLRKGITPPEWVSSYVYKVPSKVSDYSIDFDGFHYPTLASFWRWYGLNDSKNYKDTLKFLELHKNHFNIRNQGVWNRWGLSYTEYCDRLLKTNRGHKTILARMGAGEDIDYALSRYLEKPSHLYIDGYKIKYQDLMLILCGGRYLSSYLSNHKLQSLGEVVNFLLGSNHSIIVGMDYSKFDLDLRGIVLSDINPINLPTRVKLTKGLIESICDRVLSFCGSYRSTLVKSLIFIHTGENISINFSNHSAVGLKGSHDITVSTYKDSLTILSPKYLREITSKTSNLALNLRNRELMDRSFDMFLKSL